MGSRFLLLFQKFQRTNDFHEIIDKKKLTFLESSLIFFFNFKNHGFYIKIGYLRNIENQ
jgi:hypothetical protein